MSNLTTLASTVTEQASRLAKYIEENNLPNPSFAADGPPSLPIPPSSELRAAQQALYSAAQDLAILAIGPVDYLRWQAAHIIVWKLTPNKQFGNTALSAAIRFKLPQCVPAAGSATYADVARTADKDETLVTHIIRRLILDHIFDEPEPGRVTHTASSLALSTNVDGVRDWVDFMATEINHASAKTVDAMVKFNYPAAQEVHESGFGLAFEGKTVYDYLKEHPARGEVFGRGMDAASRSHAMKADHVVDCYDWKALGKASVVDVGGSFGHISIALAKHAPELTFTVQDLPETVEKGKALFDDMTLDDAVRERIKFEPYNLNDTQPATGADVYFFRTIFHNWPKSHCVRFLKNLVPALKPGARILTNEIVLPKPGALSAWDTRIAYNMDVNMITMFNAVERTDDEWREIFSLADSRFEVVAFRNPKECEGNLFAIVEAVWKA